LTVDQLRQGEVRLGKVGLGPVWFDSRGGNAPLIRWRAEWLVSRKPIYGLVWHGMARWCLVRFGMDRFGGKTSEEE
jgi:hypothetical protein